MEVGVWGLGFGVWGLGFGVLFMIAGIRAVRYLAFLGFGVIIL